MPRKETPTRRLVLVRHAHAAAGADDHERPLDARGRREAAWLADVVSRLAEPPSLVLCSTARRTRETLEALRAGLHPPPRVSLERGLYAADADELLERVRAEDDEPGVLLLVGHNPAIGELASELAGRGKADALARLREKFPPGALAVLAFAAAHWSQLRPGAGRLEEFAVPLHAR
jgi:phosphohistidine phosphatase